MTAGSTPLNGGASFQFNNDLWSFDGTQWKDMGTAGDRRSGITLAYNTTTSQIASFGGFSGNNNLGDLRILNGNQWAQLSNTADMAAAEPGFVYDSDRNRYITFGGSRGQGVVSNTTWEWDGTSWKNLNITGPAGRQAFAMVYDANRKKTVLFGGLGATQNDIFADTWEFDGTKWTQVNSSGPARFAAGYAYDSKRGLLIVFGGMNASGTLGDTWSWNGSVWQKLSDSGPAARLMGYLAYDKNRDRTVLFGGRIVWPNDKNDTWEWDGTSWKEFK